MPIVFFFTVISFFLCGFAVGTFLYAYGVGRTGERACKNDPRVKAEGVVFCAVIAILCALFAIKFYPDFAYLFTCVFAIFLLSVLSLCDEKSGYIPNELLLLFLLVGLSTLTADNFTYKSNSFLFCGGFFLLLKILFFCFSGEGGIGWGDVGLTACAGVLLGYYAVIALIFGIIFSAFGMALRAFLLSPAPFDLPLYKEERNAFFPMIPALSAGILLAAFCSGDIVAALLAPFVSV